MAPGFSVKLSGAQAGRDDFLVGLELVGEIGSGYAEGLWIVIGAMLRAEQSGLGASARTRLNPATASIPKAPFMWSPYV